MTAIEVTELRDIVLSMKHCETTIDMGICISKTSPWTFPCEAQAPDSSPACSPTSPTRKWENSSETMMSTLASGMSSTFYWVFKCWPWGLKTMKGLHSHTYRGDQFWRWDPPTILWMDKIHFSPPFRNPWNYLIPL